MEHHTRGQKARIGLVGFGHIGGTLAHILLLKKIAHVMAYDIHVNPARGKCRDMTQGLSMVGCHEPFLHVVDDIRHLASCDIIVVTAGMARKPNMEREELLHHNARIIQDIGTSLATIRAQGIILVVTNPVDIMTRWMQEVTGFPHHRVMGMAGVLDTERFRISLAEMLSVEPSDIHTCMLGAHNPSMIPILSHTTVQGTPIYEWIGTHKNPTEKFLQMLHACVEATRNEGATIVQLLENGSAYYGPAHSIAVMIEAMLSHTPRILPASVCAEGKYGIVSPVYMGMNALLGKTGVMEVVSPPLTSEEQKALHDTEKALEKNYKAFHETFSS